MRDPIDRFAKFCDMRSPAECWLWTGARSWRGYGFMKINGVRTYMHKYAYAQTFGPIPQGLVVRHTCDNPQCVNPHHLILGTHADNMKDMMTRGRSAKGEQNGQSKLTAEQVLEIRRLYAVGNVSQRDLGVRFGLAQTTIGRIIAGKKWRHVPLG